MQLFTINIPKGTAVTDPFGREHTERPLNLHIVAEDWDAAVTFITACYATHIGEDHVKAFTPMKHGQYGQELLEAIQRAGQVSGSINIEGAVFVESDDIAVAFVYASEAEKLRWVRLGGPHADVASTWNIVQALHKVF